MSDADKIKSLAANGLKNPEIAGILGRPLSPAELTVAEKYRGLGKLKRRRDRGRKSSSQYVAEHDQRARSIERRTCEDPKRRNRLEKDTEKWLRFYLAEAYPLPFGKPHRDIMTKADYAITTGGRAAVGAPRGTGKSTLLWGITLKAALQGRIRFPAYVPWSSKDMKKALRFFRNALCNNNQLDADYPEYTAPFAYAKGVAQRVSACYWKDTQQPTGALLNISSGLIVFPDSRGAIGSATVNGNPRGLNHATESGVVLRPDLVLIDDPQDRDVAKSPTLTQNTIEMIDADVMGMAGPDRILPALMACTITMRGDVADHYLHDPGWDSLCVPQILGWPKNRKLWDEWNDVRIDGEHGKDHGKAARAFYRKHKMALTNGMEVSWPARYDKSRKQPDALFSAMHDFYTLGEDAFMAERQNNPTQKEHSIYILTPRVIESRATEIQPGLVPDWSHMIVAATDVNSSYALTTTVVAFGPNQRSHVAWYGLFKTTPMPVPKGSTEIETRRIIYEALAVHGGQLAGLPCRPNHWVIDGGGSPESTVIDFTANAPKICGLQASCYFGRGWRTYRPTTKATYRLTVGEQFHRVIERRDRQWVIANADYWREIAQRGWTGSPGSPGSCSLPSGRHDDFSIQVSREQLAGKSEVGGRTVWVWNTAPGPHDYGDCMTMAYMGAAMNGIGTGGQTKPKSDGKARVLIRKPSQRR
jgi:hypothetical protein